MTPVFIINNPIPLKINNPLPFIINNPIPSIIKTPVPFIINNPVPFIINNPIPFVINNPIPFIINNPITAGPALFSGRLRAFGKCTNGVAFSKGSPNLASVRLNLWENSTSHLF